MSTIGVGQRRVSHRDLYHLIVDAMPMRALARAAGMILPAPRVTVAAYDLALAGFPRALDGLTILHLSDLHLHPGSGIAWQLPALLDTLSYDLMVWTGDFVDATSQFTDLRALLGQVLRRAPAYAVLGNHDHELWDMDDTERAAINLTHILREAGIDVLTNEARTLYGGELVVAGVDDPVTGHDDLDRALDAADLSTGALWTILLSHSPDIVRTCARRSGRSPDLILAGHTHGGQICLPLVGPLRTRSTLPNRAIAGAHAHAGIPYVVTRGVGYSGLDVRVCCPPDIGLVRLRPA